MSDYKTMGITRLYVDEMGTFAEAAVGVGHIKVYMSNLPSTLGEERHREFQEAIEVVKSIVEDKIAYEFAQASNPAGESNG